MEMGPEEFKDFMDPGDEFVIKWIKENAEDFRKNWPVYYEEWKKKKQSLH